MRTRRLDQHVCLAYAWRYISIHDVCKALQPTVHIRTCMCVRRWIFGKAMDSKETDEAGRVYR